MKFIDGFECRFFDNWDAEIGIFGRFCAEPAVGEEVSYDYGDGVERIYKVKKIRTVLHGDPQAIEYIKVLVVQQK